MRIILSSGSFQKWIVGSCLLDFGFAAYIAAFVQIQKEKISHCSFPIFRPLLLGFLPPIKLKLLLFTCAKKGFPPIASAGLSSARAMPMPAQERKAWTMPERWQVLQQRQISAKIKRFLFAPPES